jgi:hypothetical protein
MPRRTRSAAQNEPRCSGEPRTRKASGFSAFCGPSAARWGGGKRRSFTLASGPDVGGRSDTLVCRSADHLNGRSYLLLRWQPLPCRHCLAERRAVSLKTGSIVQRRRSCGIDVDFVGQSLFLYFVASDAVDVARRTSVDLRFRSP